MLYTVRKRLLLLLTAILILLGCSLDARSQTPHSPRKASLYSAVLPGLGQAYNKKYWKIPVIYAGFGVMTYFIVTNNKEYLLFKDAYEYKSGDSIPPTKYNKYVDQYSLESLQSGKDYYRRNRDLSIILSVAWYLLNIVDASVDANFFEYEINEDLSLRMDPFTTAPGPSPAPPLGLRVSLKF